MAWTHIADTQPIARKTHQCGLCGQSIEKGMRYVNRFGYCDGPLNSRFHLFCELATRKWDLTDWECCVDEIEFRKYELGYE